MLSNVLLKQHLCFYSKTCCDSCNSGVVTLVQFVNLLCHTVFWSFVCFSDVNSTAHIASQTLLHLRIFDYFSQLVLLRLLWAKMCVSCTEHYSRGSHQVSNDRLMFWNMLLALHFKSVRLGGQFCISRFEFTLKCKEWDKQRHRQGSIFLYHPTH